MSFPALIHGTEGEQFSVYSEQRHPLGTLMCLPDGRSFRFTEIGGSNIATSRLCAHPAQDANFDELAVVAAEAQEEVTVEITNGATTIAANLLDEGYVLVEDDAGEGHLYKIRSHEIEAAGSANFDVTFERGKWYDDDAGGNKHGLVVAWTTATTVGLFRAPFRDVIIHPSPPVTALAGVTPRALNANKFGWLQVGGFASVLTDGTIVIARKVMASDAVDGAVEVMVIDPAGVDDYQEVGVCVAVSADTEHSAIKLTLE